MAFARADFHRIGGGNGQTLWLYKTNDAEADIDASGYFDDMADFINSGDIIIVAYDVDGTPGCTMYQAINTAGVITVADMAVPA